MTDFPYPHFVHEETKTVFVHIPSGYPATLATPVLVGKHFPGYRGSLCSLNFIESLNRNNNV